jgi:hypothetical protein
MANRSHVDFDNPSPTLFPGSSDKRRSLQSNTRKMASSVSRFPRIFGALIALIVLGGLFAAKFAIADSRVSTAADGSSGPVLLGGVPKIPVFPGAPGTGGTPDTLIVWAGDAAHKSPDFIAVVDFDPHSPTYGKVLSTIPIPGPGGIGNEPHHVGLSSDGKTLALGGLLSVLRAQDQVFFFDVSDPRDPVFLSSNNPPHASIADEIDGLDKGGFLATFMGSPDGANPGRLVEYDSSEHFVQAWPLNPPSDGFDPVNDRPKFPPLDHLKLPPHG